MDKDKIDEEFNNIIINMHGTPNLSGEAVVTSQSFLKDVFSNDSVYRISIFKLFTSITLIVAGFILMLVGVASKITPLGVAGFLSSLAGAVWYLKIRNEHRIAKQAHKSLASSETMLNN